jgi:hypothetical protein
LVKNQTALSLSLKVSSTTAKMSSPL